MWVIMILLASQALANPKSHSLMRCGRFASSNVLSNFKSLYIQSGTASSLELLQGYTEAARLSAWLLASMESVTNCAYL